MSYFFVGVRDLPNWLIDSWISREMSECVVSISIPRANRVGFWRWDTKNFCYYPPPHPTELGRLLEIMKNLCYYPPPHWIGPASGDHGKFLLPPPPPQSVVVPLLDYPLRIRPCDSQQVCWKFAQHFENKLAENIRCNVFVLRSFYLKIHIHRHITTRHNR